ncbi:uncharacterized mitochondrial protein AtMg00810-like [Vicia villosa]|uniref:uncharacterized mitochondrial protein AtMg00810-like n=1 Tax=Vicia villosa TaxID=3911 RepID=UPI00273B2AE8|nr:uncharacterized mitochondrial protein AtMg00810-like [Vicia villosa]
MYQRKYALEILKRRDMEHCSAVNTPTKARLQRSKSDYEQNVDLTQYRILVGSLRYLCNMRPYLAFSVDIAIRFMERSEVSHLDAIKRILRYVKGTLGCEIIFLVVDTASISWCSKKERMVSLSSYETEYITASLYACQVVWLMNLLGELGSNAGGAWKKHMDGFLFNVGFKKCVSKHDVYVKTDASKNVIILCLYANDLLITRSNELSISKFKSELMEEFEMSDLGIMT